MPQSAREEAGESTLSWFILALNGLEPKERREPLRQILGTSAWGDDRVSRPEPGPER
ncbi:MAG TPA: hypothetical protein VIT00_03980 [Terrimicrobiaceae bacterium]